MLIYYDETGAVTASMIVQEGAAPPGDRIEVPDDTALGPLAEYQVIDGALVHTPPDAADLLAQERAGMECDPLQGILALGESMWSQVEAMAADPETPFPMRISILRTIKWVRNSQMMDELTWIMNLSDEQVDDLFRLAVTIEI